MNDPLEGVYKKLFFWAIFSILRWNTAQAEMKYLANYVNIKLVTLDLTFHLIFVYM